MRRRTPEFRALLPLLLGLLAGSPAAASDSWEELAWRKLDGVALDRCLPAPWGGWADLGLRLQLSPSGAVERVEISQGPPPSGRALPPYDVDALSRCAQRKLQRLRFRRPPDGRERVLRARLRAELSSAELQPGFELDLPPQEAGEGAALVALFRVAPAPLEAAARRGGDLQTADAAPALRGLGAQLVGCLGSTPPPLTLTLALADGGRPTLAEQPEHLSPEALTCVGEVLGQSRLDGAADGLVLRATWAFGPSPGRWVGASDRLAGRLPTAGSRHALWGAASSFAACWELTPVGRPVDLRALVQPDGSVLGAGALAWEGTPRDVASCLARALGGVTFPPPGGAGWAWLDVPVTPPGG